MGGRLMGYLGTYVWPDGYYDILDTTVGLYQGFPHYIMHVYHKSVSLPYLPVWCAIIRPIADLAFCLPRLMWEGVRTVVSDVADESIQVV